MVKTLAIRNPLHIENATTAASMGLGRTPTEAAENLMARGWAAVAAEQKTRKVKPAVAADPHPVAMAG